MAIELTESLLSIRFRIRKCKPSSKVGQHPYQSHYLGLAVDTHVLHACPALTALAYSLSPLGQMSNAEKDQTPEYRHLEDHGSFPSLSLCESL
jgi:hypothetical protein